MRRAVKFYFGVWIPIAASWLIVVLIAAFILNPVALGVGLIFAIIGPLAALLAGVSMSRQDEKGSWKFVVSHGELSEAQLLRLGLKKGLVLGPASVVGVALIGILPFIIDHTLTALGR